MYWAEWGRVRATLRDLGQSPEQIEVRRHALHRKALGHDKSSKALTNPDLDKVIAAFRAISDGGNLDAQLRQLGQPEQRRAQLLARTDELAIACGVTGGAAGLDRYLGKFLKGRRLAELDERGLQQVAGIMTRKRKRVRASTVVSKKTPPDEITRH